MPIGGSPATPITGHAKKPLEIIDLSGMAFSVMPVTSSSAAAQ
jgi:hypothetical protein